MTQFPSPPGSPCPRSYALAACLSLLPCACANTGAPPRPPAGLAGDAGVPSGWLYTSGNQIYVSNGASAGTPWMGRGVNTDDVFLCGYNATLSLPSAEQTVRAVVSGLLSAWKPNFLRISLAMATHSRTASWLRDPAQYRTPMTGAIEAIGAHPGVYVLVSLRSDASMIGLDPDKGDPEATGLPSDSATTPDRSAFPTGTDATYVALVDSFASSGFVLFGLTNEPGGDKLSDATIAQAMSHAVGVIRAEEDRLHVPHHLVAVQGNDWTKDIRYYASHPLPYDNVVYEVHAYPPSPATYTFGNLPVIIGEYAIDAGASVAFYADVEAKRIPNLAWDFQPYSNCGPDLVDVTRDASRLDPTPWGSIVRGYLLAHATP